MQRVYVYYRNALLASLPLWFHFRVRPAPPSSRAKRLVTLYMQFLRNNQSITKHSLSQSRRCRNYTMLFHVVGPHNSNASSPSMPLQLRGLFHPDTQTYTLAVVLLQSAPIVQGRR